VEKTSPSDVDMEAQVGPSLRCYLTRKQARAQALGGEAEDSVGGGGEAEEACIGEDKVIWSSTKHTLYMHHYPWP
jgi:hypothetical protein